MQDKRFEQCEENLSQTGLIQDYGALIRINKAQGEVSHISKNITSFIHEEASILGRSAWEIIPSQLWNKMKSMPDNSTISSYIGDIYAEIIADESGWTLELERAIPQPHQVQPFKLIRKWSHEQALSETLEHLSTISGFERAMLYKFLPDGSGMVVGENYKGNGDRYLNLRYPATDIPQVARDLYLKTAYRYIQNVNSDPVEIVTSRTFNQEPIDLTYTSVRSVSPFHIKYLKNMGVASSISFSLVKEQKLEGLFSLHHPTAIELSKFQRQSLTDTVKAYLLHDMQLNIDQRMNFIAGNKTRIETFLGGIIKDKYDLDSTQELMEIMDNSTLTICANNKVDTYGDIEHCTNMEKLIDKLWASSSEGSYTTDFLERKFPDLKELTPKAAGVSYVWFTHALSGKKITLIFSKPEVTREVIWGSKVEFYPGDNNPINSFGEWKESLRKHSDPWSDYAKVAASSILAVGKKLHVI